MSRHERGSSCSKKIDISGRDGGRFGQVFQSEDVTEQGEWRCPHEPAADSELCIFHQDFSEKSTTETLEAFRNVLDDVSETGDVESARRRKQFVGANLPDLLLSGAVIETGDNFPLVLERATIDGRFDLSDATIATPLAAHRLHVEGTTNLENCRFERRGSFREADFLGDVTAEKVTFEDDIDFTEAHFHGRVGLHTVGLNEGGFIGATFRATAWFAGAEFEHGAIFEGASGTQELLVSRATASGPLSFAESDWNRFIAGGLVGSSDLSFRGATFRERAEFAGAEITGSCTFRDAQFKGTTSFRAASLGEFVFDNADVTGKAQFGDITIERGAYFSQASFAGPTDWTGATFHDVRCTEAEFAHATFSETVLKAEGTFDDSTFHEKVQFDVEAADDLSLYGVTFEDRVESHISTTDERNIVVDLEEAEIPRGQVRIPADGVFYDMTRAELGAVRFQCDGENAFKHVRIDETVFDGFDFRHAAHRRWLRQMGWRPHKLASAATEAGLSPMTNPKEREATYNNLKTGADAIADNPAASKFFFVEKKSAADVHAEEVTATSGFGRLGPLWRFVSNHVFRGIAGYGERPLRVLGFSGVIIGIWALIFARRLPSPDPYSGPLGYVLLSFQSFITLVLPPSPTIEDEATVFLAQIEGFMGAFAVALFVFSLTRSLKR